MRGLWWLTGVAVVTVVCLVVGCSSSDSGSSNVAQSTPSSPPPLPPEPKAAGAGAAGGVPSSGAPTSPAPPGGAAVPPGEDGADAAAGSPAGAQSGYPGGPPGGARQFPAGAPPGATPPPGVMAGGPPGGFPGGGPPGGFPGGPPGGFPGSGPPGGYPGAFPSSPGGPPGSYPPGAVGGAGGVTAPSLPPPPGGFGFGGAEAGPDGADAATPGVPGAVGGAPGGYPIPGGIPGGVPGGVPGYPQGAGAAPKAEPQTLAEKAAFAFRSGNHRRAFVYMFADLIANDENAREYFSKVKWVKGLNRPVAAIRWGVGVQYRSGNYDGDPHPIGSPPQTPQMAGPGRPGGGRGAPVEPGGISSGPAFPGAPGEPGGIGGGFPGFPGSGGTTGGPGQDPVILRTTGELGSKVLEELQTRLDSGAFGELVAVYATSGGQDSSGAGSFPGYPGGAGFPGAPGFPGGEGDAAVPGGFPGAPPGYAPGPGGYPGGPPGVARPGGRASGRVNALAVTQLQPGLVSLGQAAKTEDLLKKAKVHELDVVLIFEVDVEQNRRTLMVNNTVKMVLYNVETQEPFRDVTLKSLNNIQVARARERTPDKDPVEEVVAQLTKYLDANLTVQEMPSEWDRDTAIERIKKLLEAPNDRTLQKLVEIRFYRSRQWLSNEELTSAYKHMLGGDESLAKRLATGSADSKAKAIESVIEKLEKGI